MVAPRARGSRRGSPPPAWSRRLAILPVYLPYRRAARDQHMVRTLDVVKDYSATPLGYLASAGRVHFSTWSGRFFKDPVDSFFPGFVVLVLSGVAIAAAVRRRPPAGRHRRPAIPTRARVTMLVAIGVAGVVLSLGTATPIYGWLFAVFPPMQGLRAAARFGNLFLLAVAVLGGMGLARFVARSARRSLGDRARRARQHRVAARADGLSAVPRHSRRLQAARRPSRARSSLAEQPFFPRWAIFQNGPYVLASTAHWRPLMNGYSGYTPDSYQRYADAFWYFPEDWAIQAMKDAGVTHVMVHAAAFHKDHQAVAAGPRQAAGLRADGHRPRRYPAVPVEALDLPPSKSSS